MKKRLFAAILSGLLLISAVGCGNSAPSTGDDTLNILATTYPVYLFTCAVTDGVEWVQVTRLINEEVSCLHDYTLSVNDMKAIEKADVIVMNGAGFEDFMADALATSKAAVIDCSSDIELLPATGHHDHGHGHGHDHEAEGEHFDPHFWLDPKRAQQMVYTICEELTKIDSANTDVYLSNSVGTATLLGSWNNNLRELLGTDQTTAPTTRDLITFHDGFQYFADAFDLHLLKAIEEDEGAEASAAEIKEMVALIKEHNVPVIFTEINGSDSTANAVARETGVRMAQLDMCMSGDGQELSNYLSTQLNNAAAIVNGFAGKEVLILGN